MSALQITIAALVILSSLVIIVVVLLQESNEGGLSGAIAGGTDTFFGKNKGRTVEAKLAKFTKYFGIFFFLLVLVSTIVLFFVK